MADRQAWPPQSPLKALLSSPTGRKRYREFQDLAPSVSPNKLLGSPSLLEKLRAARANRDHEILAPGEAAGDDGEEEDEDEETLELKLQAIEAKLKLKKLQQQKTKDPQSSARPVPRSAAPAATVEVALSPKKHVTASSIPKSPSRVLLGIDKGLNAEDVSLRRAKMTGASPTKKRVHHVESRLVKNPPTSASKPGAAASGAAPAKSFSERMAEMRDRERLREEKQTAVDNARSARFRLDKKEMAGYHALARDTTSYLPKNGPPASQLGLENEGENETPNGSRRLKQSRSMSSIRASSPSKARIPPAPPPEANEKGDASLFEGFSKTHLSSRILPHTFLKRTLPEDQFTIYTVPRLLRDVASPDYQVPDGVADYVVFGIICSKSSPLTHKSRTEDKNTVSSAEWEKKWDDGSANRQKFIVMKLTDLKWTVDLYLFDTAVPKYHRLAPGTLIAILNPAIMPPKEGKQDTGAFSLALHNGEDQVLEIGTAKHLGYCQALKKDGSQCSDWIDASKTEICEYHLSAQLDKARSRRSGINTMTGWSKDDNEKSRNSRQGYDMYSQSRYFAVGGTVPKNKKPAEERWTFAPTHNPNLSTAKLLDMAPGDDPFIAGSQMLERDKQDRLRKRMAEMQREHEIAKRLAKLGHNAGGEYMRHRTTDPSSAKAHQPSIGGGMVANNIKSDILADRPGESKKRVADSVRLSPVKKKTRFVTEKGIKEAGRESLGSTGAPGAPVSALAPQGEADDDDDSDLDIV